MKRSLLVFSLSLLACSKPEEPKPTPPAPILVGSFVAKPPEPPPSSPSANAAKATGAEDLTWDAPSAWVVMPNPSSMRKATYKIPRAKGDTEDAELSVLLAGGGVDANVKRWASQFEGSPEPKKGSRKVGGLAVTQVEFHGTFTGSAMPGAPAAAPRPKSMMLAAIVELPDQSCFFKLVGPEATVKAAQKDFDKLVDSVRPK